MCFELYPSIFLTPSFVINLYLLSISLTTQPKTEAALFASVITGHKRWGIPSYVDNSNILGSIRINLHFSGVCLYNKDKIIVLIQTDLPDPVVPAISKWGIEVKSPTIGKPEILFPSAIGSLISFFKKLVLEIISLKKTFSLEELGSSIPIVLLPGIVAILADSELVFLAISSDKLIILETFIPAAGSNSFKVTTGPRLTFFIFPSTPKSNRIFSKVFSSILLSDKFFSLSSFVGSFKKSIEGNLNLYFILPSLGFLSKGRSSWINFSLIVNSDSFWKLS